MTAEARLSRVISIPGHECGCFLSRVGPHELSGTQASRYHLPWSRRSACREGICVSRVGRRPEYLRELRELHKLHKIHGLYSSLFGLETRRKICRCTARFWLSAKLVRRGDLNSLAYILRLACARDTCSVGSRSNARRFVDDTVRRALDKATP